MEQGTKKLLQTFGVAAAIGGGFYLYQKGKKLMAGAKMNFALLGFRIHKINFKEVEFVVKLRCYNPTKAPVSIAINQVTANYNGSAIAFSTPNIKGLSIAAGSYKEPEIKFQVPYLNLIGKGLSVPLLQDSSVLKKHLSFTLNISINGATITTTQNLSEPTTMGTTVLGQLGIVSGPRNTKDGRAFNHLIKKAAGEELLLKNGNVIETVEACVELVANHYLEVADLAKTLQGASVRETCQNIFNFSYHYLQYKLDSPGTEELRTPARSWLDGQVKFKQQGDQTSGIDCDDYSIFVGSLLKNLGIPFKFRITKYNGRANYQHIYVFVPHKEDSEGEIIIDPVLSKFDYQKPYSFQKSDFNMHPIDRIAGIHGIDGLEGTTGLGLPIHILSGVGGVNDTDDTELMSIISGVDFEASIQGLGSADDAALNYLIRTRDFLLKSDQNKGKMSHIQNPDQFIKMLDEAIKYWNTPKRSKVLDKLIAIEEQLAAKGLIKYDTDAISGLDDEEPEELEKDDLGRWRPFRKLRKSRFFRSVKKVTRKVGKVAKKVIKAIVRFNPLSIAIRSGLLVALRLNMFGFAKKLQYGYLPDHLAKKHNLDPHKLRAVRRSLSRVKKLFRGLQGRQSSLKRAILKGAKQRSRDFSLGGSDLLLQELQALEAIGALGEMGDLGAAASAASVSAASGVLAKIGRWLKPIKNLFSKVASRFKKVPKLPALPTRGRTAPVVHQPMPSIPSPIAVPRMNYQPVRQVTQRVQPVQRTTITPTKKRLSKGAKIGIGIGVTALIGTGAYLLLKNKKKTTRSSRSKPSLGGLQLT